MHVCLVAAVFSLQDAYILTANISLEYEKAEVNAGFFYSSAEQREALVAAERAYTDERCRKVIELKKKVGGGGVGLIGTSGVVARAISCNSYAGFWPNANV